MGIYYYKARIDDIFAIIICFIMLSFIYGIAMILFGKLAKNKGLQRYKVFYIIGISLMTITLLLLIVIALLAIL